MRRQQETARDSTTWAKLADIVFDCARPAALATFWASVLDDYEIAPYHADKIERLKSLGVSDIADDPTVLVFAPTGPRLWFQRVSESKTSKNRVHLDVRSADRHAEADRLSTLGAEMVRDDSKQELIVMRDPEGNEFCIVDEWPPGIGPTSAPGHRDATHGLPDHSSGPPQPGWAVACSGAVSLAQRCRTGRSAR
jgi:hypothetical protein